MTLRQSTVSKTLYFQIKQLQQGTIEAMYEGEKAEGVQYWKLRLVWMSSRICCSSSSSNRPSTLMKNTTINSSFSVQQSHKTSTQMYWMCPLKKTLVQDIIVISVKRVRLMTECVIQAWDRALCHHLGMSALASSAASGHRLAKLASSNLWSFFCRSKLWNMATVIIHMNIRFTKLH